MIQRRGLCQEEPEKLEPSPEAREAMQRLGRMYLENVPASYLHMAVALRNLVRFSQEELRAELERRDESPAFPDPSKLQEELEQLEEAALEAARETLAATLADDELEAFERLEQFEDDEPQSDATHELEHAKTDPPPSELEPDDRAVLVDPTPEKTEE